MEKKNMTPTIQLIIIGGSSGSLKVTLELLDLLRPDFNIPVLMVFHRNNQQGSLLTELLSLKTRIIVKEVEDKEPILKGKIYLAPQDYHVLVESDKIFSLDYSEKINFSRPSIDVSYISGAEVYKKHLLCILLSGANADGAEGLKKAKLNNGTTIVQDPEEADVPYMPQQAMLKSPIDHTLNTSGIAAFMNKL
jgi:two-component system, chemotaxis family, protein-glutamate methylesterase/glutaminase